MTDMNGDEFYIRREQQARALAASADKSEVRAIHLKMAEEYAAKARVRPSERPRLGIVSR